MLPASMADDRAPHEPLELSAEETQIMLGRYAGASVPDLSQSTGLPVEEVTGIVARLTAAGLLGDDPEERAEPEAPREPEHHHAADDLVALLEAATFDLLPGGAPRPPELPAHAEPAPRHAPRSTPATRRWIDESEEGAAPLEQQMSLSPGLRAAGGRGLGSPEAAWRPGRGRLATVPQEPHPSEDERPAAPEIPPAEEPDAALERDDVEPPAEETREYRKLFEAELHALPIDQRVALAGTATGARLSALCFDPVAKVIAALFDNTATGLEHARLIAFHHRDPRALDLLVHRPAIAADPQVHRRLLKNPALTEPQQKRLLSGKRLLEIHRLSLDRDVPDKSRASARTLFRARYATASAEERVDLVWSTEGRVLIALSGLTFDSRMTSILCSKTYASITLVQNLARFPAAPPALLAHLLRQPLVKRQPHLKNLLLAHPNTPSEAKRRP